MFHDKLPLHNPFHSCAGHIQSLILPLSSATYTNMQPTAAPHPLAHTHLVTRSGVCILHTPPIPLKSFLHKKLPQGRHSGLGQFMGLQHLVSLPSHLHTVPAGTTILCIRVHTAICFGAMPCHRACRNINGRSPLRELNPRRRYSFRTNDRILLCHAAV